MINTITSTNNYINYKIGNLLQKKKKFNIIKNKYINNESIIKKDIIKGNIFKPVLYDLIVNNKEFNDKFTIISFFNKSYDKITCYVNTKKLDKTYVLKIKLKTDVIDKETLIYNSLKNHTHTNVMQYSDYYENSEFYYFSYEYCDGETLDNYILKKYDINEAEILLIIKQIITGLLFLHKNNIIHGDIKLDNILINDKMEIKIIDFDLSVLCENEYLSDYVFGTNPYIAPESYNLQIYSKKSDIWSLGILIYIIIFREFPYTLNLIYPCNNMYKINIFKHIDFTQLDKKCRCTRISTELINMLKFEDYNRPNLNSILDQI
jgi:calcium-dependent protein kinase